MIRIVGVQRSSNPSEEFVLLQNHGAMRAQLRSHAVVAELALELGRITEAIHLFSDDVEVLAGMYVLLHSGIGTPGWTRTKDGLLVYVTYMGRKQSVWNSCTGPIHLLAPQHTYAERKQDLMMV